MSWGHLIREIGRGAHGSRDLDIEQASLLFGAMLDGGVPELELGAIALAMRMKTESSAELTGFYAALSGRVHRLTAPDNGVKPVVLPSYNGARKQPNLVPLVAFALQRLGIPVLIHGLLEGNGRVASAYIFRELGLLPSATLAQAQRSINSSKIAFVPTAVLSPGLAQLLALRSRLGVRNSAHTVAKMIDPFEAGGMRLVAVTHPDYLDKQKEVLQDIGGTSLLMRGSEGEPYAAPRRRPRIELIRDGYCEVLFEQEHMVVKEGDFVQHDIEAKATAAYIRSMLDGELPMPLPIVNQIACCLYACGYAEDLNQAKAIAAVETRSFAA
ncbi:MAG TPA: DNA-binding protein YbiB [Burkholderiales bacterium]|jgi:anthranilate phosphoribosyltransferase|nr:DNA-binding protein YbiB [Burkholderiales bacterium]